MSDRHEMQAAGTHPAPCARHCESTAYEIEIRRLRAELAASREREARMQWQPIETAPKDGTSVLLCKAIDADGKPIEWGKDMQTAQVFVQVAAWWSGDDAWIVYCSQIADPSLHFDPTHWMPLDGLYAALAEGAQG